jgi:hypothetical protein
MENLNITETKSTPKVELNSITNKHYFIGESYPENTKDFYAPIMIWLKEYLSELPSDIEAEFNFEIIYFNSSSSKALMDIFYLIDDYVADEEKSLSINWLYIEENEAAEEYGEEFAEDMECVPFNLVIKEEDE